MTQHKPIPGAGLRDFLVREAVRGLSYLIGVKNITSIFWNRWRASMIGDATIMEFLDRIDSLDNWTPAAMAIVEREEAELAASESRLEVGERVGKLRRLSYLCHLAQWGSLDMTEGKKAAYRKSRDYYVQAEQLAHGDLYHRVGIPWQGKTIFGNLHLPAGMTGRVPLVVLIHGMDDSKEEHLVSEQAAREGGLAYFCFDGPGQAEAVYLDGMLWTRDFEPVVERVITYVCDHFPCDPERIGLLGISWGGFWAVRTAAVDRRVRAVYDLGGPIDSLPDYLKLPYFLKARFAQILDVDDLEQLRLLTGGIHLRDDALLDRVRCPVRIVHGDKDPIVKLSDKAWLAKKLSDLHAAQEVSLVVHKNGDHCCTGYAAEIREDSLAFFQRVLAG